MLGTSPGQVDQELLDAMGEVANMIAGGFRNRMATGSGVAYEISVPSITTGTQLSTTYANNVERSTFAFSFENHRVFVELAAVRLV